MLCLIIETFRSEICCVSLLRPLEVRHVDGETGGYELLA